MTDIPRPILAVSIAVFRDDGRVLLAQRAHAPAAALWSLPGGRVEAGETLAEAALRELSEEVAVQAEVIGFNRHVEAIGRTDDGGLAYHFVIASFVGRWTGGEPQVTEEASGVIWADPEALGELPVTRNLPQVLASAKAIWEAAR